MNILPIEKRIQIINLLVEGSSLRSASRIADVSINTVTKLLVDVGRACILFHNDTVKNVNAKKVQCDDIWSFVYSFPKFYWYIVFFAFRTAIKIVIFVFIGSVMPSRYWKILNTIAAGC